MRSPKNTSVPYILHVLDFWWEMSMALYLRHSTFPDNSAILRFLHGICTLTRIRVSCWHSAYFVQELRNEMQCHIGNLHMYLPRMTFHHEVEYTLHILPTNFEMKCSAILAICIHTSQEWHSIMRLSILCIFCPKMSRWNTIQPIACGVCEDCVWGEREIEWVVFVDLFSVYSGLFSVYIGLFSTYCVWSVISSNSNFNRVSSFLCLFCHSMSLLLFYVSFAFYLEFQSII